MLIDGVEYVRADSVHSVAPNGNRRVMVVDRGWIFAGDVERKDGRIKLTRAVWVFRWSSIGFNGVLQDPGDSNVDIRQMDHDVEIPEAAEVFCVPVADDWGL